MKVVVSAFVSLLVLGLTGCLESTTLIKVQRDGSGTIEERVVISAAALEMMPGVQGSAEESAEAKTEEEAIFKEEDLRAKALQMGEGVSLQSAEKLVTEKGSGFKAVYRFKDINKVRVNQNPGENVSAPAAEGAGEKTEEEFLSFSFTPGDPATLIITTALTNPETGGEEKEEEAEMDPDNAAMMDMVRQIYQDMKISIDVEVQGSITETNAAYRQGSRVTILEMDFSKLLEDEKAFKKLVAGNPKTLEETKALIQGSPGIKVDLQKQVRIRFR